uniref:Uncharacterized protein n=1 Tax=Chromera velia CCMP2878 TaxID=1169474 RepID=A0A0G4I1M0_9ALVE|eukprot:Cvel_10190.t1-p1 / transcript=Cvel_10190.t1 / gene=Cvel_10190 / organism=Chromera_velia_CCMP2878 / gene_product=hypothetical protein / transcript_product=hypothetical protein / location=Cvel_scaffold609:10547-13682(-) / protein_length=107 / sequence_SO=supercontig / SO=protein_coding / is_pseudo=false
MGVEVARAKEGQHAPTKVKGISLRKEFKDRRDPSKPVVILEKQNKMDRVAPGTLLNLLWGSQLTVLTIETFVLESQTEPFSEDRLSVLGFREEALRLVISGDLKLWE